MPTPDEVLKNIKDGISKMIRDNEVKAFAMGPKSIDDIFYYNPAGGTISSNNETWASIAKDGNSIEFVPPGTYIEGIGDYQSINELIARGEAKVIHNEDGSKSLEVTFKEPVKTMIVEIDINKGMNI